MLMLAIVDMHVYMCIWILNWVDRTTRDIEYISRARRKRTGPSTV